MLPPSSLQGHLYESVYEALWERTRFSSELDGSELGLQLVGRVSPLCGACVTVLKDSKAAKCPPDVADVGTASPIGCLLGSRYTLQV